jgi:hypothetical protein
MAVVAAALVTLHLRKELAVLVQVAVLEMQLVVLLRQIKQVAVVVQQELLLVALVHLAVMVVVELFLSDTQKVR